MSKINVCLQREPHGQKKEETKGQGQPVLPALVVREADEEEFGDWGRGVVAG